MLALQEFDQTTILEGMYGISSEKIYNKYEH